ncbi:MAG: hypothetical protein PVG07_00410 [Acidobacteriota bacterium]|jgi:hypothetical protein
MVFMKTRSTILTLAVVLALCLGPLSVSAQAAEAAPIPSRAPAAGSYAEGVYAEYAAGTDHRIAFEIETLERGRLSRLAGRRLGDLVDAPDTLVRASQFGTHLVNPRFVSAHDAAPALRDLEAPVARFGEVGYPLDLGTYRRLAVGVRLGDEVRQHEAVEFCWRSLGHCVVFDPAVVFLQSMVDNRLRLAAEGWGPRILQERRDDGSGSLRKKLGATASCGLASNPNVTDTSYTWGAYWVEYRNVFGITLVRKDLGSQRSGIRCDANCDPQPYGYSNASSCYGTLGWNCECDNAFGYGTSGTGTGKWIAETKCTHSFLISARASASVTDLGSINVDIHWEMEGGEDANGGEVIDTCGYF